MTSKRLLTAGRLVATLIALYACACLLGFGLLVASFRLGALSGIDILFYRGICLIAAAGVATLAILSLMLGHRVPGLGLRDAVAATIVSVSLNLSFLVVVPVTADRSVSIFMLGAMAKGDFMTPDEASRLFKAVYVDEYRQIDRRLREQTVSGNMVREGDAYRITPRGKFVVEAARYMAWLFDSHAELVAPRVPSVRNAATARR